jgi:hypothetical protein
MTTAMGAESPPWGIMGQVTYSDQRRRGTSSRKELVFQGLGGSKQLSVVGESEVM